MTITPQELLEKTDGFYKTTDIYIASSLMAYGVELNSLVKNGKQYIFCLRWLKGEPGGSDWDIEMLIAQYWSGTLKVSAKALWNAYKELKNRMFAEVNEGRMNSKIDQALMKGGGNE